MIKFAKILFIIVGVIYIGQVAPRSMLWMGFKSTFINAHKNLDLQEGDFVFQNVAGELFQVIEDITATPFTHCGMIVKEQDDYYVLEAIGPVKLTPINEWIHRGIASRIVIVRLKASYQVYVSDIIAAAYHYLNRPYDIQYEWDDEKIYCSELIYKAVRDAIGIELAEFRVLGEMNWKPHEDFIRFVSEGELPLDRRMIIPADLVTSDKVNIVYSNYRRG